MGHTLLCTTFKYCGSEARNLCKRCKSINIASLWVCIFTDSKTRNGRRPQSIADDSSDTPLTEDFEDRFKASLKAQQQFSTPGSQITSNLRRSHSLPKYQSSLTPIRGSPAPPQARASPVTRRQTPTKTRHSPALPKYTPSKTTHQYTGERMTLYHCVRHGCWIQVTFQPPSIVAIDNSKLAPTVWLLYCIKYVD